MTKFMPGLELNRRFYWDVIRPIIDKEFPRLRHSAARLGSGSEVLGYDTPMSTDHDWGPRLQLFLAPEDFSANRQEIHARLQELLPSSFLGYSTHFGEPDEEGTRLLADTDGLINHRVELWTVADFFADYMACDPFAEATIFDWLTWPQQLLLGVTAGEIYVDDQGQLAAIRRKLSYYPHDLWLYLLAAQWSRIGQEEHFVGRTGDLGDDLGSRILATRLVHDLMLLCFLLEKRYAPYPKWFGTAFARLACARELSPILGDVLRRTSWQEREYHLGLAYEFVARKQNDLKITRPLATDVRSFHGRPFKVIDADRFVKALKDEISDPAVQKITADIGSIDQFSDNTDLRSQPRLHKKLQAVYK